MAEVKQPKTIVYHPSDFVQYIQQTLGVINFQKDFDHFFLNARLFMSLINQTNEALRMGIVKRNDNKKILHLEATRRLNQVWYGHVYIWQQRDSDYNIVNSKIRYPKKPLLTEPENENEEIIMCPALENMNPVNMISDKSLFIKIREFVPIKWAWWGQDYANVVTSGKFHWNFAEGQKPYFESDEDIIYSDSLTDDVSREYFHKMINILTRQFEKYQTYIFMELHKIIEDNRAMLGGNNQTGEEDFDTLIGTTD